jgi:hypothetical protein
MRCAHDTCTCAPRCIQYAAVVRQYAVVGYTVHTDAYVHAAMHALGSCSINYTRSRVMRRARDAP